MPRKRFSRAPHTRG